MAEIADRRGWGGALAAGLLLRAVFCWHHPRFTGDTLIYGDLAGNLLRHGVYGVTEDRIRPTLLRLPGYPLLLAACFTIFGVGRYVPVIWVQAGLDLLGCWMLAELARRVGGARLGRWVVWLAALCPFTASYAAAALTETLSLLCVVAALLGLRLWQESGRLRWAGFLGVSLAAAVLLRPDQGLLGAAVLPVMLWRGWRSRCGRRAAGLTAMIMALPLAVWGTRNWRVFHVIQPLAPKYANDPGEAAPLGFARWYRTWAVEYLSTTEVYWIYDGQPLRMEELPARAYDGAGERKETAALLAQYNQVCASTPALEAAFDALGRRRIREHPSRYYVELPVARLADMWLRPRTELLPLPVDWWRWRSHPWRSAMAAGYGLLNLALLGMAAAGLRVWWRCGFGEVGVAAVLFCVLRCGLLLTIDNAEQRYTVECFPVVLLCVGWWLAERRRA